MNPKDEILDYLLRRENLVATLDIISRASEIRQAALKQCWDGIAHYIRHRTPQRLVKLRHMRWEFYPPHLEGQYRTLYFHDHRLPQSAEALRYCLSHWETKTSFEINYGIQWWQKPQAQRSRLLQLPAVARLRQELNPEQFECSGWWLARCELFHGESREDFIKRYAGNPKQVESKAAGCFWQLVEETFDLLGDANRAIQRAVSK